MLAGGGSQGYDIITYYQGYRPLYTELEILEPIDPDKIPNIDEPLPVLRERRPGSSGSTEDGTWTGVPWTWGSIGITWDDATSSPRGLDLVVRPARAEVQGQGRRCSTTRSGAFTLAAHILGKDPAALPKAEYAEIEDFLTQIVAQAKASPRASAT